MSGVFTSGKSSSESICVSASPAGTTALGSPGSAIRRGGTASLVVVVVPDINLLVFAYNEAAPRHDAARA
jgi:hypothetical protein